MMACQGNYYVWILLLAFIMVCRQVYVTHGRQNFTLPQPNVTVSSFGFNFVNISWKAEEVVEKGHFSFCYNFSYLFLDKGKSQNSPRSWVKLTNNYRIMKLRMHTRLEGSVSTVLCNNNSRHIDSKPAEFVYNAPQVYIYNVSCVLFNITNLNCSWDFRKDAPDDNNYSFALRLNSKWSICRHYFSRHNRNVGCYMQDVYSDYKDNKPLNKIRIGFFSNSYNFSKTFRPDAVEILTAPRNIQVISEKGNTIIKWLPPTSLAINGLQEGFTSSYYPEEEEEEEEEEGHFQYEIRVIENKSNVIFRQKNDTEKEEQIFTDLVKHNKYYTMIRAKHKERCQSWGEWSTPVYINKDHDVFPEWILILIVPALFAALIFYLCKRYMKMLLVTPIPHPSQNMKNWLHMDGSNDMRLQANVAVQNEQTVSLTEIEIVTTTGDTDCDEKP